MKTELIEIEGRSSDVVITTQERIDDSKSEICEMDIHFTGQHGIEQRTYLNLFLAAPELLEIALQVVEGYDELDFDLQSVAREAKRAIAKATGNQA